MISCQLSVGQGCPWEGEAPAEPQGAVAAGVVVRGCYRAGARWSRAGWGGPSVSAVGCCLGDAFLNHERHETKDAGRQFDCDRLRWAVGGRGE